MNPDPQIDAPRVAADAGGNPSEVAAIQPGVVLAAQRRYRIDSPIGKGGFGAVFLARCLDTDPGDPQSPPELVAIKVFEAPAGKDPRKFLKRELSAMLAMKCDRIPRVYDWEVDGPLAFVVMHYYPYGSLVDASPFGVALSDEAAWRLLTDLLSALRVAHANSILHLDIKPANVLLDGNGGFVLTDFGISQGANVSRSIVAPSLGSPGYQSPEQKNRKFDQVDARTDLWGAAITVWGMYTGVPLYLKQDLIRHDPAVDYYGLPPLRSRRPDANEALEEVLMQMLAVDPANRPGGAAEVLAQIRSLAAGAKAPTNLFTAAAAAQQDPQEAAALADDLFDPLWITICRTEGFEKFFVKFQEGETICAEGDDSHFAFVLLKGAVEILKRDQVVFVEDREGTFLGEVATLTGSPRTASMRARTAVWAAVFNAAELERFVTCNPAVGIRLIKSLAQRLQRESIAREA